ncbi:sugar kinase [Sphingopyxis macrogoltabida]|uniref:2-keto-3-deoxygluconate kinase n=1 Tax=Sphingopyxis macrogoltabida TaxID=33050 RepID=A0AAC9AXY0_SPHMC|nr:sugar kinase [Sphingopyxis macrogoltabida]ALJ15813.1 2-keto-3-deoxygluconate kinase [Sphingopyxis macrogoltabida]AMU92054.1 2-keto-3-deoxygluconate kinase [Sphingopyxis macrogoltabida]
MPDRLVFFGELLIRLTAPGNELLMQSPALALHVGGAEANVAIGLAHLGHDCAMVSTVPANALGRGAVAAVRGAGVDCGAVATGAGRMGLYFLSVGAGLRASEIVYDRAGSSFAARGAEDYDWDALLAGAGLLHLSGITPALGPRSAEAALAAARAAKRLGVPVSFDGNYRAMLWQAWDSDPRAILGELIGLADIFFGNHRDLSLVLGKDFGGEGEDRRREAAEAGFAAFPDLRIIASTARHVLTADHHRVAARVDRRDSTHQTGEVDVTGIVDRIGAGDAFAAGVLHAWRAGGDARAMAETGLALTCLKHSLPGDASRFGAADIAAFHAGGLDVRR